MPAPEDDFVRTSEDPLTFFRLRALHLAPQLGVSLAYADEAISVVYGALGRDWLAAVASDESRAVPLGFGMHPLGTMISVAGAIQVSECLELAEYLRQLATSPQLSEIVTGLKVQYYQTLLQLATAARLAIAGAEGVSLEPAALEGRLSDVAFAYDGRQFRAECYRPTYTAQSEVRHEMMRVAQVCLDMVKGRKEIYSIAIAFLENPTAAIRKESRRAVGELTDKIDEAVKQHPDVFPALTASHPWGVISIARALPTPSGTRPRSLRPKDFPEQGDDFDMLIRVGVMRKADAVGVTASLVPAGPSLSHIAIWLPAEARRQGSVEEGLDDRLEKLGRKIERKLGQARNEVGAGRVIVVDTWLTAKLEKLAPDKVERLRRKIVEAHADVAALLMVNREWMPHLHRHGYQMRPLLPTSRPSVPHRLLESLAQLDRHPDA